MRRPPPQHLLSPKKERLFLARCSSWQPPTPTSTIFLFLIFLLIPLSAPSSSQQAASSSTSSSSSWVPPTNTAHWSIPSEEVCPSARAWVVQPGSFCSTLWDSPYLSNRTELEARERRAVQIYCELDVILERFDCGQEYSVNVERGQCQLCRQAYREWVCAVVTDTQGNGSLDCVTKLMPCPSCASICHQVMRLCPYLSPDRMQFDLYGQSLPQVSQYGGHPAFYCPLENDDPSDPAYTSLCVKPYLDEDPDHVHNICTHPPKTHSSTSKTERSRRNHHDDSYDHDSQTTDIPSSYENEDESTDWSSEFPHHYTTCCWTYASSLVMFDDSKNYPNYGSDAFFSRTLNDQLNDDNGGNVSKVLTKSVINNVTLSTSSTIATTTDSTKITTTLPSLTTTTRQRLITSDSPEAHEPNRVILNCCNSLGACNAVDGDEKPPEDDYSSRSPNTVSSWNPVEEIKSDNKLIKNRKRSSERLGRGNGLGTRDEDEEDILFEEEKSDGSGSTDSSSISGISVSSSSSSVLSPPSLFFKTIDLPNPTHISELEDVEYDEHYLDTEPDLESSAGSSTEVEEEEEEEEGNVLLKGVKKLSGSRRVNVSRVLDNHQPPSTSSTISSSASSSTPTSTSMDKGAIVMKIRGSSESGESVHYGKKQKKNAFMAIVISDSSESVDEGGGVDHVLDRDQHHRDPVRTHFIRDDESEGVTDDRTMQQEQENEDDESFTFADNTNTLTHPDESSSDSSLIRERLQNKQQSNYYYARHGIASSSSSKPQFFIPLQLLQLLSPTYLISAVFTLRMCLDSFVVMVVLLLVVLLLVTFTTTTINSSKSKEISASVATLLVEICWSFLPKTNFLPRRTRTKSSSSSSSRYKKSCVHASPTEQVKEIIRIPPQNVILWSKSKACRLFMTRRRLLTKIWFKGRLNKLRRRKCCCSTTVVQNGDVGYYKYYRHLYNYYSASVQSSLVDLKANCTISYTTTALLIATQQQDYFHYYCYYYYYEGGHDSCGSSSSSSSWHTWGICQSRGEEKKDDNNCSTGRRKRRRKASVISSVCSRHFKEIFRDFQKTLDFHGIVKSPVPLSPSCTTTDLLLLLLPQLLVAVVLHFQFLTFIASKSKSLTCRRILHARLLVASKYKYKLQLNIIKEFRLSSNYYATTNKRRRRRRENAMKVNDSSSPSNKNEATPLLLKQHQIPIYTVVVWVGFEPQLKPGIYYGGHSSSQCCRTIIILTIHKIATPSPTSKSITITILPSVIVTFIINNTNKFLVQLILVVVAVQKWLCMYRQNNMESIRFQIQISRKCCPNLNFSRRKRKKLWFRVEFVVYMYHCSVYYNEFHLLSPCLLSLPLRRRVKAVVLLLLLRGQSNTLITELLLNTYKTFKVYARETLKFFGKSTKKSCCSSKKSTNLQKLLLWCSSYKAAAGFEIHPLIKL